MINVYIVSGFLGAGKTTFIQKLLKEKKFERPMLLENEFGEVGVDAVFFDKSLNIREINNGCICCSLQGDFEDALEEIEEMGVSDLIIEPSGVGKLSEIINVVKADPDFRIVSHICIVDVKTCRKYHLNFKEYFNDQVAAANAIILSHTDVADEETIEKAIDIVNELNDEAEVVSEPVTDLPIEELLNIIVSGGDVMPDFEEEEHHHDEDEDEDEHEHHHDHEHHHEHHHDHDHHHHHHHHDDDDDENEHEHEHHHHHHHEHEGHHHADEVFTSVGIETTKKFTEAEIADILKRLDYSEEFGTILRAKGIVAATEGEWIHFDHVPEEYEIRRGSADVIGKICVIDSKINEEQIKALFA